MNLDTGAAVNTFPVNFIPEGIVDEGFYDWIPDGEAWQIQGYDENGLPRSLNGRLTDAHQVLCSAAEIACKEQQDFYLGPSLEAWHPTLFTSSRVVPSRASFWRMPPMSSGLARGGGGGTKPKPPPLHHFMFCFFKKKIFICFLGFF